MATGALKSQNVEFRVSRFFVKSCSIRNKQVHKKGKYLSNLKNKVPLKNKVTETCWKIIISQIYRNNVECWKAQKNWFEEGFYKTKAKGQLISNVFLVSSISMKWKQFDLRHRSTKVELFCLFFGRIEDTKTIFWN